ncbi:MAG: hypothetical protein CM15mP77_1280 [Synechococcus sp.]|nr:MAG: hypothetical protein CM15mP77_1280 [Synechococcus sp.]
MAVSEAAFASEPRMQVVEAERVGFHERAEKLNGRMAMLASSRCCHGNRPWW